MTTVLHTGDTHVGYQQYHEPERRADFLRGFESVVEDAIAEDVDAVVHAGDLFHDRRPDLQDLQGVVAGLRELRDAEIPFLAIVGNHEAKRSGQWLDLFADLDLAERLGAEPRTVGDLALYGLDHVPQSRREELAYEFDDHDAAQSALVAHGLFEPFDPGEWDTEHLLESASVEFDAMLLGDNHDPGTQQVDDTWVTYPGSTERASASERTDRGYNLVHVEDGELRIARRTIETRRFVFVDVELEFGEGADVVRDRVREFDHDDAVTVVTIEGAGEPVAPGPIEELARDRGALVARVNDRRDVEAEDGELDVHFSDPDEAVRQQLRELGLSEAARDLDRVIRDETVADANVREVARRHVDEHLEDGLASFEPAPDDADGEREAGEDSAKSGPAAGAEPAESDQRDAGADDGARADVEADGAETEEDDDDLESVAPNDVEPDDPDDGEPNDLDDVEPDDPDDGEPNDPDAAEPDVPAASDAAEDGDGQASMEEYL